MNFPRVEKNPSTNASMGKGKARGRLSVRNNSDTRGEYLRVGFSRAGHSPYWLFPRIPFFLSLLSPNLRSLHYSRLRAGMSVTRSIGAPG